MSPGGPDSGRGTPRARTRVSQGFQEVTLFLFDVVCLCISLFSSSLCLSPPPSCSDSLLLRF